MILISLYFILSSVKQNIGDCKAYVNYDYRDSLFSYKILNDTKEDVYIARYNTTSFDSDSMLIQGYDMGGYYNAIPVPVLVRLTSNSFSTGKIKIWPFDDFYANTNIVFVRIYDKDFKVYASENKIDNNSIGDFLDFEKIHSKLIKATKVANKNWQDK
jgi:hypothetical protein